MPAGKGECEEEGGVLSLNTSMLSINSEERENDRASSRGVSDEEDSQGSSSCPRINLQSQNLRRMGPGTREITMKSELESTW